MSLGIPLSKNKLLVLLCLILINPSHGRVNIQKMLDSTLDLRALHVLNGIPYIVAEPHRCFSFNKWGRPNPPYVIFKYSCNTWRRIKLEELPHEFATFNVVQNTYNYRHDEEGAKLLDNLGYVSANKVKELNGRPELNVILREPVVDTKSYQTVGCAVMVRYKDGDYKAWSTLESFKELQKIRKLSGSQPVELIEH